MMLSSTTLSDLEDYLRRFKPLLTQYFEKIVWAYQPSNYSTGGIILIFSDLQSDW